MQGLLKEHVRDMIYGAIKRDYLVSTLEFDGHFLKDSHKGKRLTLCHNIMCLYKLHTTKVTILTMWHLGRCCGIGFRV